MPSSTGNERIPLTGADCFLRAFDDEVRRYNGASHVSQLLLRLGPGFDPEALRELTERVTAAQPILRSPIRRAKGIGAPRYQTDRALHCPMPEVRVHETDAAAPAEDIPTILSDRMNQRLDIRSGELLRFDVLRYHGGEGGTDLAMSWVHMLLDGAGSERFVHWLDDCFHGRRSPEDPGVPVDAGWEAKGSWGERGQRARQWQDRVHAMAAHPPRSLAGPLRKVRQALQYEVETFGDEQSAQVVTMARQRAGFLTPMLFYLAAAIRAHHAVFRHRGSDPGSYVVPLPVNVRPKGAEKAIFRTHVSLLWFQVMPEQVEDFDGLLEVLRAQRLESIKQGLVENGLHAMEFARFAPQRLYSRMARRNFGGESCSFFFAFTGDFLPGCESFLGAPIHNGFHAPAVPPSPGSCVAMSLYGKRLNVTHVRQDGVLAPEERSIFWSQLRTDLLQQPE